VNGLALDTIEATEDGGLRIGALVRNTDLAADARVRRHGNTQSIAGRRARGAVTARPAGIDATSDRRRRPPPLPAGRVLCWGHRVVRHGGTALLCGDTACPHRDGAGPEKGLSWITA